MLDGPTLRWHHGAMQAVRRQDPAQRRRGGPRLRLVVGLLLLGACSAEGTPAPIVASPDQPGGCGTLASITTATRQALDGGLLDPFGRQVRQRLVETGQYRVFFHVGITLIRQAPLGEILDALARMIEEQATGHLVPTLFEVVDYVTGHSSAVPGEHYELTNVAERVFRYCDPRADFATLRRLLEFAVPCPSCPEGVALFTPELLRATSALLNDPVFLELLDTFEFDSEGEHSVGLDAFNTLLDLVLQNLSSPSFDWEYTRGLITDALGPQLSGESRARFDALLDLLGLAVAPAAGILPDLQVFLGCLHRHDENHALSQLGYDFARSEELEMGDLLSAAAETYDGPAGRELLGYLADIFGIFERDSRLASEFLGVIAPLLGEPASRDLLPTLSALRGQGVGQELRAALELFLSQCKQDPA